MNVFKFWKTPSATQQKTAQASTLTSQEVGTIKLYLDKLTTLSAEEKQTRIDKYQREPPEVITEWRTKELPGMVQELKRVHARYLETREFRARIQGQLRAHEQRHDRPTARAADAEARRKRAQYEAGLDYALHHNG